MLIQAIPCQTVLLLESALINGSRQTKEREQTKYLFEFSNDDLGWGQKMFFYFYKVTIVLGIFREKHFT